MVLQSDVAAHGTIALEVRDHRLAVQCHVVNLSFNANRKCVPVARLFGGDLHRGLYSVDRASLMNHIAVRRAFVIDLDFIAFVDGDPWIAAWFRKAHEDTRVVTPLRD